MAFTYKDCAPVKEAESLREEWTPQPAGKQATIADLADECRQSLQSLVRRMDALALRVGVGDAKPEKIETGNQPPMCLVNSCQHTRKLLDEAFDLMGKLENIA